MDEHTSTPPIAKNLEFHLSLGLCISLHYRQGNYFITSSDYDSQRACLNQAEQMSRNRL
jgi:hypothetical protein